ncbi:MAG: biotin carboxyl carrier protein, partial [Limisphaerales bacterium]
MCNIEAEYPLMKITINEAHSFDVEKGKIDGIEGNIDLKVVGKNSYHIIRNGKSYYAELVAIDESAKQMVLRVNGHKHEIIIKDRFDALLEQLGMEDLAGSRVEDLKAPMPGLVLDIMIEAGQSISKGDPVLILEAMKMENVLKAPGD